MKVKSALDNVLEERNVLTMMKSNFVTNLKYALQDEDTLFLIMDLMLGGDLKFHLINAGRFTEKRSAGGQRHSESRRDHVVLCNT